jgi:GNAT superfamily N-acetyltransferase
MTVEARWATADDIPEIVRVINAAYQVEEFFVVGPRTHEGEIRSKMDTPGVGFLVSDGVTGLLAASILVEVRGERGYFGMLSVDPARQREGLGRRLVHGAEAHCRAAGCTAMDLVIVNLRTELVPYYERFGYRITGTQQFHSPEKLKQPAHLVVMSRPL